MAYWSDSAHGTTTGDVKNTRGDAEQDLTAHLLRLMLPMTDGTATEKARSLLESLVHLQPDHFQDRVDGLARQTRTVDVLLLCRYRRSGVCRTYSYQDNQWSAIPSTAISRPSHSFLSLMLDSLASTATEGQRNVD